MTDWKRAGEVADAHRVRNSFRAAYQSGAKRRARARAIRYLKRRGAGKVLDLWGGGESATALVAAGLNVLSVDDGRQAPSISASRMRRALAINGATGGYETAFGSAWRFAAAADAAFLDFCGHWSREVERTVRACRHMTALVVTLMPERADIGSMSRPMWAVAYAALLEASSGLHIEWQFHYRRSESGQWAIVFGLRRLGQRPDACVCGCGLPVTGSNRRKYATASCGDRYRARLRRQDPLVRERERVSRLADYHANAPERRRTSARWKAENPDRVREHRDRRRARYAKDPAYREHVKRQVREGARRRREGRSASALPTAA